MTTSVNPFVFFVCTFLLSWLIWIPLALSHFGIGPFHIPEGISSIVRLLAELCFGSTDDGLHHLVLQSQPGQPAVAGGFPPHFQPGQCCVVASHEQHWRFWTVHRWPVAHCLADPAPIGAKGEHILSVTE